MEEWSEWGRLGKISVVQSVRRAATSTDTFVVKFSNWPPGYILFVDAISLTNETTDTKTADVGVRDAQADIYLETLALTTHARFYKTQAQIAVPSRFSVIVRLNSPTSGDKYVVNVFAHLEMEMRERLSG